ncbi:MAG: SDR family NAD(P)-dependent oxidoreductase [Proteobacteria bacterium]|nr:SDR family NAD(P)-dependent oxidoreductase [Pseudomonadota bacterium]
MGELEGRVAIVTGAGRGIGAAVAEGLAAEGAGVLVNDLGAAVDGSGADASPARQVVERIVEAGGTALPDATDVTDFGACEALIRSAVEEFGRLDVLVNVAGILRDRMIFKMSEEEWDAVVDVHLKGTFNTTRHAAAYWRENRGGQYRLINFTSGSGLWGAPGQPNYAASKLGIVGLTLSCANALRPYGVTSNCISPVASTRMTATVRRPEAKGTYTPENRRMAPENVVPAVLYLASERSDWLNRRVVGAGNGRISLHTDYAVEREIVSSTGLWGDTSEVFAEIENSFKGALEHPNPFDRPRG